MRRSIMRRGGRTPVDGISKPRVSEAERLAKLTREIAEETGGSCALLLGLIERRAPGVTPTECAAFILEEWRKDGDARARLLDRAMKSPAVLAAERELAREVQTALRGLAGKPYSVERAKDIRRVLVKLLRAKLPKLNIAQLTAAVKDAVDYSEDRLVVRTDALLVLLAAPPLAS